MNENQVALEEGPWRVLCVREGDRLHHTIERFVHDRWIGILRSSEGSERESWPPSPPMQQLVLDEIEAGTPVLLGVGMAGTSHWSMSLHVQKSGLRLVADLACRSSQMPEWLGSSYRLEPNIRVEKLSPQSYGLWSGDGLLATMSSEDSQLEFEEGGMLRIVGSRTWSDGKPKTNRWKYWIDPTP